MSLPATEVDTAPSFEELSVLIDGAQPTADMTRMRQLETELEDFLVTLMRRTTTEVNDANNQISHGILNADLPVEPPDLQRLSQRFCHWDAFEVYRSAIIYDLQHEGPNPVPSWRSYLAGILYNCLRIHSLYIQVNLANLKLMVADTPQLQPRRGRPTPLQKALLRDMPKGCRRKIEELHQMMENMSLELHVAKERKIGESTIDVVARIDKRKSITTILIEDINKADADLKLVELVVPEELYP
ncbi:hypothetical protein H2200_005853 [Cladophialophora chaetospira]|uniref:Uncharacterized protein n=1 Tax=Cladophialophora chaetospira TaxID=386627 RepID=A0AA39CII0_9EURO|nr:hypothetical protein H2200_005853 [Cladophialophora chaetospira]